MAKKAQTMENDEIEAIDHLSTFKNQCKEYLLHTQ